jgi:hypothetical protein
MPLQQWANFYVIVGSAAAALTGLQFVVMALSAQTTMARDASAVDAFATPTIVHLGVVLTISALMSVPRLTAPIIATALAIVGAFGIVYSIVVVRRTKRQTGYTPVLEDWLWHIGFPFATYGALCVTGVIAVWHLDGALDVVAAIALALLFIGIHNAWDSAVYISTHPRRD